MKRIRFLIAAIVVGCIFLAFVFIVFQKFSKFDEAIASSATSATYEVEQVRYVGSIYHIFFHSLVVYPELAFRNDEKGSSYRTYMITRDEFNGILKSLYKNDFVLVDIASIYSVDKDGNVSRPALYLPKGKRPLIISLDDQNYYYSMKGRGFADKLVLDVNNNVATEIITPEGKTEITRDGDIVPILDDFVRDHPDFSVNGAKGVIALTGFQGILGYRTEKLARGNAVRDSEILKVKPIVERLRATGWRFASHSYAHSHPFLANTISLDGLKKDTEKWKDEVETLVGKTDIFIGPFGQIFKPYEDRRQYLISAGFKMFCGVGSDLYLQYFNNHAAMNRNDIDGYRLFKTPSLLKAYFDPASITGGLKSAVKFLI